MLGTESVTAAECTQDSRGLPQELLRGKQENRAVTVLEELETQKNHHEIKLMRLFGL